MAGPVRCRGGLVADEMGLGKTIEIIGTMVCNPRPHTLVVVPLALLQQWKVALARGNAYQPLVYHGAAKTKLDPAEIEFPFNELTIFEDLEVDDELQVDPKAMRKAYLEDFAAWREDMRRRLLDGRVDYRLMRTDASLDEYVFGLVEGAAR